MQLQDTTSTGQALKLLIQECEYNTLEFPTGIWLHLLSLRSQALGLRPEHHYKKKTKQLLLLLSAVNLLAKEVFVLDENWEFTI